MEKQIFRKKSLDRISSPEQLNDYIRASNPGVWLILGAVLVLAAGALVWGVFGKLDTTVTVCAVSADGAAVCYIRDTDGQKAEAGMPVIIGEEEYFLAQVSEKPMAVDGDMDAYILHVGGFEEGDWVYSAAFEGEIPEGVHAAQLVVDRISPMSFVAN